jgi:hypothetical protein
VEDGSERLRWGVRRRLEFIDFRLFWDGRFNRSDLAATFGISAQQASADIGHYEKIAAANLRYDRAEKAYIRTDDFAPAFIGKTIFSNSWRSKIAGCGLATPGSTPSRRSKLSR